jgi:hypothetical protein
MTFEAEADLRAAERDEWSYLPNVGVGPFRFGMSLDEVIEAAEVLGWPEVSDRTQVLDFAPTWRIEVHRRGAAPSQGLITSYVSKAMGLYCIVPDALNGPQVVVDGIPLVGRDQAELESDVVAYAEANDAGVLWSPSGYAGPHDFGIVICPQRVGQVLLSRPSFMVTHHAEWDSLPYEEHQRGRDALRE